MTEVNSPALYQADTFREELTAIFNHNLSVAEAEHRLGAWIAKVERASIDTFDGGIKTLRNHWHTLSTILTNASPVA